MIEITPRLAIPDWEIWFEFSHASGPGGQNVNKVASQATLCFDVAASGALSPEQKARLRNRLANRIDSAGLLRVRSGTERGQHANRKAATARFQELLREGLRPRTPRRPTKPTRGSQERRIQAKRHRAQIKRDRRDDGRGELE